MGETVSKKKMGETVEGKRRWRLTGLGIWGFRVGVGFYPGANIGFQARVVQ